MDRAGIHIGRPEIHLGRAGIHIGRPEIHIGRAGIQCRPEIHIAI